MSYNAFAREWRPQSFNEIVGQQHVLQALSYSLDHDRLHHAYLLTGTRGVGKTTIARLIGKSLNCEQGVSSHPCNQCASCKDITNGRYADFIEIDAASRTKVEDTRELLDNIQYAPTRGRYKIYLIDEVHMLSGHSFNALLKTLEEPPAHVKFILATTDPDKLPVTILSRCLRFHLKALSEAQIQSQLERILTSEQLRYEDSALKLLSRAAKGSMRDALSLLDQMTAHGHGEIREDQVRQLLGLTHTSYAEEFLLAIAEDQAEQALLLSEKYHEQASSVTNLIEQMQELLHQISIGQLIPTGLELLNADRSPILEQLSQQFTPEQVQLLYQILLIGKRDLVWAPNERIGFEMILMRMLAFSPCHNDENPPSGFKPLQEQPSIKKSASVKPSVNLAPTVTSSEIIPPLANSQQALHTTLPVKEAIILNTPPSETTNTSTSTSGPVESIDASFKTIDQDWNQLVYQLDLKGLAKNIALHCSLAKFEENHIQLNLDPKQSLLLNPLVEKDLQDALEKRLGRKILLKIVLLEEKNILTPARIADEQQQVLQQEAQQALAEDANFQRLLQTVGASIKPELVEPLDISIDPS